MPHRKYYRNCPYRYLEGDKYLALATVYPQDGPRGYYFCVEIRKEGQDFCLCTLMSAEHKNRRRALILLKHAFRKSIRKSYEEYIAPRYKNLREKFKAQLIVLKENKLGDGI